MHVNNSAPWHGRHWSELKHGGQERYTESDGNPKVLVPTVADMSCSGPGQQMEEFTGKVPRQPLRAHAVPQLTSNESYLHWRSAYANGTQGQ